jgi:quercetin dioxygenase-like cupin family protein
MYSSHYQLVYNQIVDGIKIKVLNQDESVVMTELELKKGTKLPAHIHTSDHSAYLLKGRIRMISDKGSFDFFQGDSWCIKKDACHSTEALEDSVVLEVYSLESENIEEFQYASENELVG